MLKENIGNLLNEDAISVWPEKHDEIVGFFDKACFAISVDIIIKQLGLFQCKNDFETLDTLRSKIKLFEHAEYVLTKMLDILCEEKVLEKKDGGYLCINSYVEIESATEILTLAAHTLPQEGSCFQWLARAAGTVLLFLQGKIYGEEAMIPYSDFSLLENVYYKSDITSFYPRLAAKAIRRIVDSEFDNKVTIFEVGAGTGNSAYNVLNEVDNIEEKVQRYVFTDISKALVKNSSKKFDKYSFMEYKQLDVGGDIIEQGFSEEIGDIVFGVNVLHATNDLSISCGNLFRLVKKGGFVILGEISPPKNGMYRFMELTFGLLGSYYNYNDTEFRPESPIMRADKWIQAFNNVGFTEVISFPNIESNLYDRGGIIIAKR